MVSFMNKLSNEQLMAFVDGELSDLEAKKIREALCTDAEAQERVELFKNSRTFLQEVYDAPFHEEIPTHLIDGIINFKNEEASAPSFFQRIISWLHPGSRQPVHALAFSMILMIGIGTGWFAARLLRPELTTCFPVLQGEEFSRGLERTVSGMSFKVDGQHARITPIATFLDTHGHYCRQYEVVREGNESSPPSQGVACRTKSGDWLTRVFVAHVSPDVNSPATRDSFVPAGDHELATTLFSHLMAAPPLTIDQEKNLIRSGWNSKK